jgi:hypothetical protein
MKNKNLEQISNTYKNKSNKELSSILVNLNVDFKRLKDVMVEMAVAIGEVEETYDKVYNELQKRLKFKEENE